MGMSNYIMMASTVTSASISILRIELLPRAKDNSAFDMTSAINGQWTSDRLASPNPH